MTQTIGWWDYDETDRPTLINRDSGERVRMGDEVQIAGKRPGQRWVRFDYLHDDLEFPLLVCWMPELGHIVVDYLASFALWREETNSEQSAPPYGVWVRVDECLIDALWCWPETIDRLKWQDYSPEKGGGWIGRIGGWCNGAWRPEFVRIDIFLLDAERSLYSISQVHVLGELMPLYESAPSPWFFCAPNDTNEYQRKGFSEWEGKPLHAAESIEDQDMYYGGTPGIYTDGGRRTVEVRGMVPQMRSRDGKRILYPFEASIVYPEYVHERDPGPPADYIEFRYCVKKSGCSGLMYHRPGPWEFSDRRPTKRKIWPRFHIVRAGSDPSARARMRYIKDLSDAFLFWEGTSEAPELWGPQTGDVLSYERPEFIMADSFAARSHLELVKSFSSLAQPDRWDAFGFDLPRFMEVM